MDLLNSLLDSTKEAAKDMLAKKLANHENATAEKMLATAFEQWQNLPPEAQNECMQLLKEVSTRFLSGEKQGEDLLSLLQASPALKTWFAQLAESLVKQLSAKVLGN